MKAVKVVQKMAKNLLVPIISLLLMPLGLIGAQQDVALYLMGKALMEDGTPFSHSVKVEMVCNGRTIRQSFVNEKGVFSFDLGSVNQSQGAGDAGATPTSGGLKGGFGSNATSPGGFVVILGRIYLDDCLVRLQQNPEFASTQIQLGIRGLMDDPDIGEILVRRVKDGSSNTVDISKPPIPSDAEEASLKAIAELEKEKPDLSKAAKNLQKAVEIYPDFDAAWALLGEVRMEQGKTKEAEAAFSKAAEVNPKAVKPRLGLAQLSLEQQRWQEASEWAELALELEPSVPRGLLYSGLAGYYAGDYEVAMKQLERLKETGKASSYPIALLHLGMLYAMKGDVPKAAEDLRVYLEVEHESNLQDSRRKKIEQQLKVWEEQGLINQ
jgi:predicted Zn-dependent protease